MLEQKKLRQAGALQNEAVSAGDAAGDACPPHGKLSFGALGCSFSVLARAQSRSSVIVRALPMVLAIDVTQQQHAAPSSAAAEPT